ncbi:Lrp/AsnC family transcriptional regulator [Candidatus Thorarchaeota archaeon]|nr:MAG: Lrp/AsnC family transcriptional regulator [Candidatus Thorarchaeota archaeon]
MDQLDRDLIRILQKDAKRPFTQIAEELNQPDTTIHFRTRRLKENNIVTRFCALLHPDALGYTQSALLHIEIGGHILPDISKDRTQTFAMELAQEEHFLWVAIGSEPMKIHTLVLGTSEDDILQHIEDVKKSPDVVNVSFESLNNIVKGWEISGNPE